MINLAYLASGILFIIGLKGLTSPVTARRGNRLAGLIAGAVFQSDPADEPAGAADVQNADPFRFLEVGVLQQAEVDSAVGQPGVPPDHDLFAVEAGAPGLRLDRIFVSPALTAVESRVGTGRGSDHR